MSIVAADSLQAPPLPPKRGRPLLAWFVIVAAVSFEIGFQPIMERVSQRYATREQKSDERAYLSEVQLQGREIVGMVRNFDQSPTLFESQLKDGLAHGPYESRLRFIVLTGELNGPAAALEQLSLMRENEWTQRPPTSQEEELTNLLERLYRAEASRFAAAVFGGSVLEAAQKLSHGEDEPEGIASALSDDDRRQLREKLNWFGDLALTPAQDSDPAARAAVLAPARQTAVTGLWIAIAVFFMAVFGFFLLATGSLLLITRLLRPRFQVGSVPLDLGGGGFGVRRLDAALAVWKLLPKASKAASSRRTPKIQRVYFQRHTATAASTPRRSRCGWWFTSLWGLADITFRREIRGCFWRE
jgi:hypothetical protein